MTDVIHICSDLIDQMLALVERNSEAILRNDATFVQGLDDSKIRRQIPRGQAAIRAFLSDLKVGGNSNILHSYAAKLSESSLANQVIPVVQRTVEERMASVPSLSAIVDSKLGSVVASISTRLDTLASKVEAIAQGDGAAPVDTVDPESIKNAVSVGIANSIQGTLKKALSDSVKAATVSPETYATIVQKTIDRTTTQRAQKRAAAIRANKEAQIDALKEKLASEGKTYKSPSDRRKEHAQQQHEAAIKRHDRRKAHHERMVAQKAAKKEKEKDVTRNKAASSLDKTTVVSPKKTKTKFVYRSPAAKLKFQQELVASGKVYYTAEQRREYQARRKSEDLLKGTKSALTTQPGPSKGQQSSSDRPSEGVISFPTED